MYDETKGVEGYTRLVNDLQKRISDPATSQGKVQNLGVKLREAQRFLTIAQRNEYVKTHRVNVYGSDDYVGAQAGDTSFYFGYEVTRCPVKSHKSEDDCYETDCNKREWVFQVERGNEVVFEMLDSAISYPEADCIERKLIIGMAHYIKSLTK